MTAAPRRRGPPPGPPTRRGVTRAGASHPLPRPLAADAARRLVVAAHRTSSTRCAGSRTRASRPWCSRRSSRRRSPPASLAVHDALEAGAGTFAEALDYLPERAILRAGSRSLPRARRRRRSARCAIPVIASLNGDTPGGWLDYARSIEAGRRRRARAQPLPGGRRPGALERAARGARPRGGRGGPRGRSGSRSPSSSRRTSRVSRTSPSGWSRPGPTGSCSSTASTSRISTSRPSR